MHVKRKWCVAVHQMRHCTLIVYFLLCRFGARFGAIALKFFAVNKFLSPQIVRHLFGKLPYSNNVQILFLMSLLSSDYAKKNPELVPRFLGPRYALKKHRILKTINKYSNSMLLKTRLLHLTITIGASYSKNGFLWDKFLSTTRFSSFYLRSLRYHHFLRVYKF